MPIETFPIGPLETNCHIVISGSDAVAVDLQGQVLFVAAQNILSG